MNDTELQVEHIQHFKRWTPEERGELLTYIANGYTFQQAADAMGRTRASVDTELKDIRIFYGAKTLCQMIYIACQEGIVDITKEENPNEQEHNNI